MQCHIANTLQATVLNLLLRNYLEYNLYEQADKLVSKVPLLTDSTVSSNQFARFLYYQGILGRRKKI